MEIKYISAVLVVNPSIICKDGGLDKFYEIRKGYIPGSIKKIKVDEDPFVNDIKRINEKTSEISLFISDIRCAACIWLIEIV